jgi:hypothetical protein
LVTFERTDPLWTLDLANPRSPRVLGALQVPGVSTYIHPVGENHLLTIGFGGDEEGLDWTTRVSLFDVSDFSHPREVAVLPFASPAGNGWSYAWSEANYEHKAFQFWQPLAMLAIPLTTYRGTYSFVDESPADEGDDASGSWGYYHYEYKSVLELVTVNTQTGTLVSRGTVSHSEFYNANPTEYWNNIDIRRSIFMNDREGGTGHYVYAISDRGITANRIDEALTRTAWVALAGQELD